MQSCHGINMHYRPKYDDVMQPVKDHLEGVSQGYENIVHEDDVGNIHCF